MFYEMTKNLVGAMAIEHLQLDPKVTAFLKKKGAMTISEACVLAVNRQTALQICVPETLIQALDLIEDCASDGKMDWLGYWARKGGAFCHPFMTCDQFEAFSAETPLFAVTKAGFGNAGSILAKNGYRTFGSLVEGLRSGIPDIPGIGVKKLEEFFEIMVSIASRLKKGEDVISEYVELYPITVRMEHESINFEKDFKPYDLPASVKQLSIGSLHLGRRARILQDFGIKTVADLVDAMPEKLMKIKNIGHDYMVRINSRLRCLEASIQDQGVNWQKYTALCGVPFITRPTPQTGYEFLSGFESIITEIASHIVDPVTADLLLFRLSKSPEERLRLDQISNSVEPPITRERVRQKEVRLLSAMKKALVFDDYSELDIHIEGGLCAWWKNGYEAVGKKTMNPGDMSEALCSAWGVSPADLSRQFPLISAVLTGEITTRLKLKETLNVDLKPLKANRGTASVPLAKLLFPTSVRFMATMGLKTVSDLVDAIKARHISRLNSAKHGLIIDHLALLTGCLDKNGEIDWKAYFAACNAAVLPSSLPKTSFEFLLNLDKYVKEIIDAAPPTMRSSVIFEQRTSRPMFTRLTMEQMAAELGSYAPGIKKEETELLSHLKAVIINDEWGRAGFGLHQQFAAAWHRLVQIYDYCDGDVESFVDSVTAKWKVTTSHVEAALPTIIAVITGYPHGRLVRHSRTSAKVGEPALATA